MASTEIIKISPSQLNVWLGCPQAWQYGYVDRLKPKGATKSYFNTGSYVHQNMHFLFHLVEAGYNIGSDIVQASVKSKLQSDFSQMVEEGILPREEFLDTFNRVSNIMIKYLRHQSPIIDSGIQVEGVEEVIEIEHTLPSGRVVLLNGIVDLRYLIGPNKRRHLRDHKSGENAKIYSQEKTHAIQQLQFYVVIFDLLGIPIDVMEISFLSTYKYKNEPTLDQLFKYFPVEITPAMRKVMREWLDNVLDAMLESRIFRKIHPGCTSCGFWPICKAEMRGLPTTLLIRGNYERKDDAKQISNEHTEGITNPPELYQLEV